MSIICQNPASYFPTVRQTSISDFAEIDLVITSYDEEVEFKTTTTDSSFQNYQIDVSEPAFRDDYELENLTPAIASLNDGLVERITDGVAVIRVLPKTGGFPRKDIRLNMSINGHTYRQWSGYTRPCIGKKMLDDLLDLMVDGKTLTYYSGYDPADNTPTRDTNCWAASLGLTGSAFATDLFGSRTSANSGALITPRHVVGVPHWDDSENNMGSGKTYWFADASGALHERTVLARYRVPQADIQISVLNSAVPAGVTPFPIAGTWFQKSVVDGVRNMGAGFSIDQGKRIRPVVFDAIYGFPVYSPPTGQKTVQWNRRPDTTQTASPFYGKSAFLGGGITGDSGGFVGGISQGDPFLVSLFTGADSGMLYMQESLLNSYIAAVDALASVSTGLTVTVAPDPTA